MEIINPESGEQQHVHTHYAAVVLSVVTIFAIGTLAWFGAQWAKDAQDTEKQPWVSNRLPEAKKQFAELASAAGIGSEIYEEASNPIAGKLPDAAPTVTNPVEDLYKNPFE